jgi:hypothetical protein
MLDDVLLKLRAKIGDLTESIAGKLSGWLAVRDSTGFRSMELEVGGVGRQLADEVVATVLQEIVADPTLQAEASLAARQCGELRHGGTREVEVTLLGGKKVRLKRIEYVKPNRRGKPGRPRRSGNRGAGGVGIYPVLAILGIWFGVTPAVAGEVSRQVADSDSVRAGRAALARRGIDLGHKRTLRIVNKFGARAVEQRQKWLEQMRRAPLVRGVLRGKRVVVATDGGRLRERVSATRGRRNAKTGHRRYDAPWREPKLLTIYTIGEDGTIDDEFQPVYDGTLGDADAIFDMLAGYLKALGVHEAGELIFLGDGAEWIWNRVPNLVKALDMDPSDSGRVRQVIDWPHAIGVLHEIAAIPANWSEKDKQSWIRRAKKCLHAGKVDALLELIDALAVGRRAKSIKEHRDYFARNSERMQYATFEEAKIPTGSGAIESAVRRVVNMRMKSNGMFWLEVNAESMLLLRSYLKAGYFDTLTDWSMATAVPWWTSRTSTHAPSTPLGVPEAA